MFYSISDPFFVPQYRVPCILGVCDFKCSLQSWAVFTRAAGQASAHIWRQTRSWISLILGRASDTIPAVLQRSRWWPGYRSSDRGYQQSTDSTLVGGSPLVQPWFESFWDNSALSEDPKNSSELWCSCDTWRWCPTPCPPRWPARPSPPCSWCWPAAPAGQVHQPSQDNWRADAILPPSPVRTIVDVLL